MTGPSADPTGSDTKKEEGEVKGAKVEDEVDEEDPYAGYEEQQGNTRAADLYLDTVSPRVHPFDNFTDQTPVGKPRRA